MSFCIDRPKIHSLRCLVWPQLLLQLFMSTAIFYKNNNFLLYSSTDLSIHAACKILVWRSRPLCIRGSGLVKCIYISCPNGMLFWLLECCFGYWNVEGRCIQLDTSMCTCNHASASNIINNGEN